jgi:hypothetical protein
MDLKRQVGIDKEVLFSDSDSPGRVSVLLLVTLTSFSLLIARGISTSTGV